MPEIGHVSQWHPYQDNPGQRHIPVLWDNGMIGAMDFDSVEHLIDVVGGQQLYVFCNDLMDEDEFPENEALLRHKKTEAYMSRTQKVVALRCKSKRKSGFFIPTSTWGIRGQPNEKLLENVQHLFDVFGYEAITPSSLSEKVLRSTLPEYHGISRPSDMLRRVLLENSTGGRIDRKEIGELFPVVYRYDMNKAYFHFSKCVPSPFKSPRGLYYGEDGKQDSRWRDFSTGFYHVVLAVHGSGLHPIQISEADTMRNPRNGELIDRWLWKEEVEDCLEKGYTLEHVYSGYGWREMSNFMEQWADIVYAAYEQAENKQQREMIKTMMVGLPGRFLKSPENYLLIHETEYQKGDIPVIIQNWGDKKKITTPWFIRAEYNLQSAQLTPIGSYIIMKCRQEMYHRQLIEAQRGNIPLSSYIDCYTVASPTTQPEILGSAVGQYKMEEIKDAYVVDNQIIPVDFSKMRTPGFTGQERFDLWRRYHGA